MSLPTDKKNPQTDARALVAPMTAETSAQKAQPKTSEAELEAQPTKRVELEAQPLVELRKSEAIYEEAKKILPSGASSNVRVYKHEPFPVIFARGKGSRVWDVDGNEYIDYLLAYGPLILGHCHPSVINAIREQIQKGTMFGTTTELEVEVAKKIASMIPAAEMVSFSNSGTEATMEAVRITRAFTGRDKILKFEGHYHGHHDYVLFSVDSPSSVAGLELAPTKLPFYPGIPEDISHTVTVAPWNNLSALERTLKKYANDIAAVIMEPVIGSSGVIPPADGYLKGVRELTQKFDVLLIFDEILTGFRIAKGGAQEYYGVTADLACFAKALGNGAPIAAITGRRDVMEMIGPGKIGYGGTYNANPLSLAVCKATLDVLSKNDGEAFTHMNSITKKLTDGLQQICEKTGHDSVVQGVGPMFQLYFTRLKRINTYRQSLQCDYEKFKDFREMMLERGVYFHPDGTERLMLSAAHTSEDIEKTLSAAEDCISKLPKRYYRSRSPR
ncbi:aspartate aminotransferase family protein [[Eubacterium] cellulosolvens]